MWWEQVGHVFIAHGGTEPGTGVVHMVASPHTPPMWLGGHTGWGYSFIIRNRARGVWGVSPQISSPPTKRAIRYNIMLA